VDVDNIKEEEEEEKEQTGLRVAWACVVRTLPYD
jgi:hypothetical protein